MEWKNKMDNLPPLREVLKSLPRTLSELTELESILRPRGCSTEGFMGKDERLVEIIVKDYFTLKRLGLTYNYIANRLDELFDINGGEIGDFKFCFDMTCGVQYCPWPDTETCKESILYVMPRNGKPHFKREEFLKNKRDGKLKIISGLLPHLIRDHYFFEGLKTNYRVDPEEMYSLFNPTNELIIWPKRN